MLDIGRIDSVGVVFTQINKLYFLKIQDLFIVDFKHKKQSHVLVYITDTYKQDKMNKHNF